MRVVCTCGRTLSVSDELVGKTVRCPSCNRKLKIEAETEEMDALEDLPESPPQSSRTSPGKGATTTSRLFLFMAAGVVLLAGVVTLAVVFWPRG
jgi:hypothetical protein